MKKKCHVVLTKNEPEIIAFKNSLPQDIFSNTVAKIMTESLKDEVATIPMNFKIRPVIKDVHTKISLSDDLIQNFCKKFGCKKGNLTSYVKTEIKKCIQKNLNFKPSNRLNANIVKCAYDNVFIRAYQNLDSLPEGSANNHFVFRHKRTSF